MKTFSLFQELDIAVYTWDKEIHGSHRHSFFEIFYIFEGKGKHIINGISHEYEGSNLFLLVPGDLHHLDIEERTKFCVLIFNRSYFTSENLGDINVLNFAPIFRKIEFILQHTNHLNHYESSSQTNRLLIHSLINTIIQEQEKKDFFYEIIIRNTIFQILCLIARRIKNNVMTDFLAKGSDSNIAEIVFYLQENIYDQDELKLEKIAQIFNKTRNYLTFYFKQHTGYSIKEFIQKYRLDLLKGRLSHSNLTVKQLAYEFGFSDENHLNKFLKKYLGMTATAFRQNKDMI